MAAALSTPYFLSIVPWSTLDRGSMHDHTLASIYTMPWLSREWAGRISDFGFALCTRKDRDAHLFCKGQVEIRDKDFLTAFIQCQQNKIPQSYLRCRWCYLC